MTEEICSQGHVIDKGLETCSRDGSRPIGYVENAPVLEEEVSPEIEEEVSDEEVPEQVEESTEAIVEDVETESEEETTEEESENESEDETLPAAPEDENSEEELG